MGMYYIYLVQRKLGTFSVMYSTSFMADISYGNSYKFYKQTNKQTKNNILDLMITIILDGFIFTVFYSFQII